MKEAPIAAWRAQPVNELRCENIGKRYGNICALRNVTFRCSGGLVGLVGPNGAGKSTLMRILATLLPQTEGVVSWNGKDTRTQGELVRSILGYLPQDFGLYPEFSARQFLRYLAMMKGLPRALARVRTDEVLELVNLGQVADRKLRTYSGGMKRRVGIAQALLNSPALLIVDEPTAGLDPEERVRFRTLLASLTANRLIIFSTHIIADVAAVANRLIILREGLIEADVTPDALLSKARGQVWAVQTDPLTALRLQDHYQVSALVHQQQGVSLRIVSPTRPFETAEVVEPSLEDAYLLLVGRQQEPPVFEVRTNRAKQKSRK
ncbi:MAG TPA: ABC transporter ATP-binding protein [Ktedonobacteraceae bacterium]|jgi:ABC-2 type transport system ATP-binding protein|nr:ABC transporter ATP-binding protein [Ktedonobacteraceae bacterium]